MATISNMSVEELDAYVRNIVGYGDPAGVEGCGYTVTTQFYLIVCGILVFVMQGGFALLEAGSVGSTAVVNILFKNMMDCFMGVLAWWIFGYAFSYGVEGDAQVFIGSGNYFTMNMDPCEYAMWFFQWTFAATAVTIVSGAMAGRTRLVSYCFYSVIITGFVYPVVVHWTWSGSAWLTNEGYSDFAGSGIVHMVGGMAALVGAKLVGPRGTATFENYENKQDIPGHSMPLVALGTVILIFGFFGFNGGSVLAMDSAGEAGLFGLACVNTILSASGGAIAAVLLHARATDGKFYSLMSTCNGAIAGMVSVCAGAAGMYPYGAWITGFIGGCAYRGMSGLLHRFQIDDAIDAVGVHYAAGFWGLIAVGFFDTTNGVFYGGSGATLGWNILGGIVISAWTAAWSVVVFGTLRIYGKLRVDDATIDAGIDVTEHGESAYIFDASGVSFKRVASVSELSGSYTEAAVAAAGAAAGTRTAITGV